jgi:hypothetical protein
MTEEAIIKAILDEAFYVHKRIGPGMLENVLKLVWYTGYRAMAYLLKRKGQYPSCLIKSEWNADIEQILWSKRKWLLRQSQLKALVLCKWRKY